MKAPAFNTTVLFYPNKNPKLRLFALWYFTTLLIVWSILGHLYLGFEQSHLASVVGVGSAIRGLPHVGLTAHMRRMSWINSGSFPGRPGLRRDFHRQNILNPARCQPMTVSGRKIINGVFQFGQALLRMIQSHRSHGRSSGLCARRLSTVIWCRRARTSMASSC